VRKLVVLLAIMAGSIFTLGAGASTASAASCDANQYQITYTGDWQYQAYLTNCTGVSAVQFGGSSHFPQNGVTWVQGSGGRFYPALQTTDWEVDGIGSYYSRLYSVHVFGPGCGAPPITVHTAYTYRIYNAAQRAWGAWHGLVSTNYLIC
jgi:hypothetical protein